MSAVSKAGAALKGGMLSDGTLFLQSDAKQMYAVRALEGDAFEFAACTGEFHFIHADWDAVMYIFAHHEARHEACVEVSAEHFELATGGIDPDAPIERTEQSLELMARLAASVGFHRNEAVDEGEIAVWWADQECVENGWPPISIYLSVTPLGIRSHDGECNEEAYLIWAEWLDILRRIAVEK